MVSAGVRIASAAGIESLRAAAGDRSWRQPIVRSDRKAAPRNANSWSESLGVRFVVKDNRSREEVLEPTSPLGEQHGHEACEERHNREHEPDQAHERSTDRGGIASRAM